MSESNFKTLLSITHDGPVLAKEMKELLSKELCLGMTRHVCRHGTLGEGFDKLTDSQKYYQSLREVYTRSNELARLRARAKQSHADYLEAVHENETAKTEIEKLRSIAKLELAELSSFELLVTAEDTLRQLDEFQKVRMELQDKVRMKYPEGIEQAEPDNWQSVAQYWATKKQLGALNSPLTTLPLPAEKLAELANDMGMPELFASTVVREQETIKKRFNGNFKTFLEDKFSGDK